MDDPQESRVAEFYTHLNKDCEALAKQGNANAQCVLGLMYEEGKGVPSDYVKAIMWYEKAAEQGPAEAQHYLAKMYYLGIGVEQDFPKAAKWYEMAAQQGDAFDQGIIGRMYFLGQGVAQDYVKAYFWLNCAILQGNEGAIETRNMVASHLSPEDIAKAKDLYLELIEKI